MSREVEEQARLVVEALVALAKLLPETKHVSVSMDGKPYVNFHTRSEEGALSVCSRLGIDETSVINGSVYGRADVGTVRVTVSGPATGPKPIDPVKAHSAFAKADEALGKIGGAA